MTTPFSTEVAVAAIEARHPQVRFARYGDRPRGWGDLPAQADGHIGKAPFYLRLRYDTASLDIWPADTPVDEHGNPDFADIATTASILGLTGEPYTGSFDTVEQAVETFDRLLAAQAPVTTENPTTSMRIAAALEAMEHADARTD